MDTATKPAKIKSEFKSGSAKVLIFYAEKLFPINGSVLSLDISKFVATAGRYENRDTPLLVNIVKERNDHDNCVYVDRYVLDDETGECLRHMYISVNDEVGKTDEYTDTSTQHLKQLGPDIKEMIRTYAGEINPRLSKSVAFLSLMSNDVK